MLGENDRPCVMVYISVFVLHQTVSVHLAKVKVDNNFNKYSITKININGTMTMQMMMVSRRGLQL